MDHRAILRQISEKEKPVNVNVYGYFEMVGDTGLEPVTSCV